MTVEIISWSISTKVWYRAGIELTTPGIVVRHASVARHVTERMELGMDGKTQIQYSPAWYLVQHKITRNGWDRMADNPNLV